MQATTRVSKPVRSPQATVLYRHVLGLLLLLLRPHRSSGSAHRFQMCGRAHDGVHSCQLLDRNFLVLRHQVRYHLVQSHDQLRLFCLQTFDVFDGKMMKSAMRDGNCLARTANSCRKFSHSTDPAWRCKKSDQGSILVHTSMRKEASMGVSEYEEQSRVEMSGERMKLDNGERRRDPIQYQLQCMHPFNRQSTSTRIGLPTRTDTCQAKIRGGPLVRSQP
mmetsp:Transcript_5224/g.14084  ORF Transcript_5224/g.14084 Transcript_5224/m.14084 type:complete len:220 (+) Transcript_5224:201-860(+)